MMMEGFDVFFLSLLQESEKDGDGTTNVSIETCTRSDLIHDAECRVQNLINFFTSSFFGMIC